MGLQEQMAGVLSGMNPAANEGPKITQAQAQGLLADCRDIVRKLAPRQNDAQVQLTPVFCQRIVSAFLGVCNLLEPHSGSVANPATTPPTAPASPS